MRTVEIEKRVELEFDYEIENSRGTLEIDKVISFNIDEDDIKTIIDNLPHKDVEKVMNMCVERLEKDEAELEE